MKKMVFANLVLALAISSNFCFSMIAEADPSQSVGSDNSNQTFAAPPAERQMVYPSQGSGPAIAEGQEQPAPVVLESQPSEGSGSAVDGGSAEQATRDINDRGDSSRTLIGVDTQAELNLGSQASEGSGPAIDGGHAESPQAEASHESQPSQVSGTLMPGYRWETDEELKAREDAINDRGNGVRTLISVVRKQMPVDAPGTFIGKKSNEQVQQVSGNIARCGTVAAPTACPLPPAGPLTVIPDIRQGMPQPLPVANKADSGQSKKAMQAKGAQKAAHQAAIQKQQQAIKEQQAKVKAEREKLRAQREERKLPNQANKAAREKNAKQVVK